MKRKTLTRIKIVAATMTAVFSLFAAISGTYAWFSTNQSVSVGGGSFKVMTPEQIEYEMYYLDSFTDSESESHDGNQNSITDIFSGYQVEYEDASFTKINYEDGVVTDDPDPTNIEHLWPAHKLTYAFIIKGSKAMSKLSITDWSEVTGSASVGEDDPVHLSWAIDIYGAAYSVLDSGDDEADIATGYQSYYADLRANPSPITDAFDYSEDDPATDPVEEVVVVSDVDDNLDGYRTIVFFTIEFSNDEETFYRLNKTTGYYEHYTSGDLTGFNSNCYEGLTLSSLTISIA